MVRKTGRPTKLTRVVQAAIVDAIAGGNYGSVAAQWAGIHPSTLTRWMARGRAEFERLAASPHAKTRERERPYLEFFEAVEQARAAAEVRNVALINDAAKTSWQAAAWWLERTRPDRFGRRGRLNVTIRQEAERLAAEFGLDLEEVLAEAERILRGAG